jgi:hypothetical protein
MGIVPVAPRSKRLLFAGDKKYKGFNEKPDDKGLSRREITYMPRLA